MKPQDVPYKLKGFHQAFMKLTNNGYKIDLYTGFQDFLDWAIFGFTINGEPGCMDYLTKKYGPTLHEEMYPVLQQWTSVLSTEIQQEFDWYDVFGEYYMALASSSKQSAFGQFFTPEHICDMMTRMTCKADEDRIQTVNDPACGSGRTLLSAYCYMKGKAKCYAEDLDAMCVKMTALNFLIHGVRGEVICHNSLIPDTFNFGYKVNRNIEVVGIPYIEIITREESDIIGMWEARKQNPVKYDEAVKQQTVMVEQSQQVTQLNLFQ